MKVFDKPNPTCFTCPICGTSDEKPVTPMGVSGTEEGLSIQAIQVHIECLDLQIGDLPYSRLIYMNLPKDPKNER